MWKTAQATDISEIVAKGKKLAGWQLCSRSWGLPFGRDYARGFEPSRVSKRTTWGTWCRRRQNSIPCCAVVSFVFSAVPGEPELLEFCNPFWRYKSPSFFLAIKLEMSPLPLYPNCEWRVLFVFAGHITVTMDSFELKQLIPSLFPHGIVRIPYESDFVQ